MGAHLKKFNLRTFILCTPRHAQTTKRETSRKHSSRLMQSNDQRGGCGARKPRCITRPWPDRDSMSNMCLHWNGLSVISILEENRVNGSPMLRMCPWFSPYSRHLHSIMLVRPIVGPIPPLSYVVWGGLKPRCLTPDMAWQRFVSMFRACDFHFGI